jgi:hypothetical protein
MVCSLRTCPTQSSGMAYLAGLIDSRALRSNVEAGGPVVEVLRELAPIGDLGPQTPVLNPNVGSFGLVSSHAAVIIWGFCLKLVHMCTKPWADMGARVSIRCHVPRIWPGIEVWVQPSILLFL